MEDVTLPPDTVNAEMARPLSDICSRSKSPDVAPSDISVMPVMPVALNLQASVIGIAVTGAAAVVRYRELAWTN